MHLNPETMQAFEELFALPETWRKLPVKSDNRALIFGAESAITVCADELEAILEGKRD
jgi:hypothetical protein